MITITKNLNTRYAFRNNHTMLLSIEATTEAGGVLHYQWMKDGAPVTGVANHHEIHYSAFDQSKAGVYWCVITDAADHSISTNHAIIEMDHSSPVITVTGITSPFTVAEDHPCSLTVAAETSFVDMPLSYEWVVNGVSQDVSNTATIRVDRSSFDEHNGLWRCYIRSGDTLLITKPIRVTVERVPFLRVTEPAFTGNIKKYTQKILDVTVLSNTRFKTQWYTKLATEPTNWTMLEGETNTHYVTDVLEVNTHYKCEMTYFNEAGVKQVVSSTSELTMSGELDVVFTTQPTEPATLVVDQDVLLECVAESNEPEEYRNVFYQWYKGSEAIQGETKTTLSLMSMQKADGGSYKCVVTVGTVNKESNIAALVVNDRQPLIQITGQPSSEAEKISGVPWTLSITLNTNYPKPLKYQWQRETDGVITEIGENSPILHIESPAHWDDGQYTCRISAREKNVGTTPVNVTFHEGKEATITVINQPDAAQAVMVNEFINISVTAHTDGFPFRYQWFKDGAAIEGATEATYYALATNEKQSGAYNVKLHSGDTEVESNVCNVIVEPNTDIISIKELGNKVLKPAEKFKLKADVKLKVGSLATLTYQWYKNGSVFAGKTGAELEVVGSANGFDHYRCQVTATHEAEHSCMATNQIWVAGLDITSDEHRYIHPLLHRNTSFVFMGYWVIDYINKCNEEKFNWVKEYKTTKYPLEIATILAGINLYGGNFALESRNGRLIASSLLPAYNP